jgi:hypothetical protein
VLAQASKCSFLQLAQFLSGDVQPWAQRFCNLLKPSQPAEPCSANGSAALHSQSAGEQKLSSAMAADTSSETEQSQQARQILQQQHASVVHAIVQAQPLMKQRGPLAAKLASLPACAQAPIVRCCCHACLNAEGDSTIFVELLGDCHTTAATQLTHVLQFPEVKLLDITREWSISSILQLQGPHCYAATEHTNGSSGIAAGFQREHTAQRA